QRTTTRERVSRTTTSASLLGVDHGLSLGGTREVGNPSRDEEQKSRRREGDVQPVREGAERGVDHFLDDGPYGGIALTAYLRGLRVDVARDDGGDDLLAKRGGDTDLNESMGQVHGQLAVHDGAQDRDARHGAELSTGVDRGSSHAGVSGRNAEEGGGVDGHDDDAKAHAGDSHGEAERAESGGGTDDRVGEQHTEAREEGEEVEGEGVGTDGCDDLEVERHEEEDGEDREVARKGDSRRAGEGPIAHPLDVQHRVLRPRFDDEVDDETKSRNRVEREDATRLIPPRLASDGGERAEAECYRREHEAVTVDASTDLVHALGQRDGRDEEND